MNETRYCEQCDRTTEHTVEMERDANNPPESFTEAEAEGYASQADCTFFANGDSEYRITCAECGNSYKEV